jgi:hypothetical protein
VQGKTAQVSQRTDQVQGKSAKGKVLGSTKELIRCKGKVLGSVKELIRCKGKQLGPNWCICIYEKEYPEAVNPHAKQFEIKKESAVSLT